MLAKPRVSSFCNFVLFFNATAIFAQHKEEREREEREEIQNGEKHIFKCTRKYVQCTFSLQTNSSIYVHAHMHHFFQ